VTNDSFFYCHFSKK